MQRKPLKVMIIGAGTGGLCLAQGLKQDGVAVEVFERDHSPMDRLQGYRLSISPAGCRALKACLPDPLFAKLVEESANPSEAVTFLDHRLHRLLAIELPRKARDAVDSERPISRIALRRILLEGLGSEVHFGRKFVSYEETPGGGVLARFDDGSTASADVLVGADGASSPVRGQRLPQARRVETGITVVSGKFSARREAPGATPPEIWRGPTLILGPQGRFMFSGGVEYDSCRKAPSGAAPAHEDDYAMWGVSARHEDFALPTGFEALNGAALKSAALKLMGEWHPTLQRMVQRAEPSTVVAFPVKTSVPVDAWPTTNVTLMGDALHNMTPYGGVGANTALRDAAALRVTLVAVDRGEQGLIPALATYERDMIDYGFAAVRLSLGNMRRFHARSPLARAFTKTFFRTVDLVPPLQAMFRRGR
jgi:2-polyprenyl-6-methoxyphenol hydroxylase-like FAD-dependent oxidoreductase